MAVYVDPKIVVNTVLEYLSEKQGHPVESIETPWLREMSWSTLYFLTVRDASKMEKLVVKIVHFPDQTKPEVSWQSEELLTRVQREYDSMTKVYEHFATSPDPRLQAIPPRGYIPSLNAIVMEFVEGSLTYRDPLKIADLLTTAGQRRAAQILKRAGSWLRWFHRVPLDLSQAEPHRMRGPAHTFETLKVDAETLRSYGVDVSKIEGWADTLAVLGKVEDDTRVWVHGDFHPNNLMVLTNDGVLGFDTAFEEVDSPYLDLSKFIVNIKTRRTCILSRGLLPTPRLTRWLLDHFIDGYLDGRPLNRAVLALYEGRFLLEKWAETLDTIQSSKLMSRTRLGSILCALLINPFFQNSFREWMHAVREAAIPTSRESLPASASGTGDRSVLVS